MAATDTWHAELACDSAPHYAIARDALQAFLDARSERGLWLVGMGISELPASYFALPTVEDRLEMFWCAGNALEALPATLSRLPTLKVLDCDGNRLESLHGFTSTDSRGPTTFPRLEQFYCGGNSLTELPAELGRIVTLERLWCDTGLLEQAWAEGGPMGDTATLYTSMNEEALAAAWKARSWYWTVMAPRRVKAARN